MLWQNRHCHGQPAHDLDGDPVVCRLDERNDRPRGQRRAFEVGDHAGADGRGHVIAEPVNVGDRPIGAILRLIEPRNVSPGDARGNPGQLFLTRQTRALELAPEVANDGQARLAVTHHEQVDERCQELGVLSSRSAGDDQGVVRPPILGMERDPAQVEHRQDVGVADLVLEREPQHVELAKRRERLQAVQRQALFPQSGLEVGQRREGALARPAVSVHQAVQDLKPVMAHTQRIGVRESQANGPIHGAMVLNHAVQLAADVLPGGANPGQDPREHRILESLIEHRAKPVPDLYENHSPADDLVRQL